MGGEGRKEGNEGGNEDEGLKDEGREKLGFRCKRKEGGILKGEAYPELE